MEKVKEIEKLGIIGRGTIVDHGGEKYTFYKNDIDLIEKLSLIFNKINYAPFWIDSESKKFDVAKSEVTEELKRKNITIFKLKISDRSLFEQRLSQLKSIKYIKRFLKEVDFVLIFWPSAIAFYTYVICKIKRKKFAVYKGGSFKSSNVINVGFKSGFLRNIFANVIENFVQKNSPVVFVRGGEKYPSSCYVRGNSLFNVNDVYKREDSCNSVKIRILNVSSLLPVKNVDVIIRALKVLRDKKYNVFFYHAGVFDRENHSKMEELIKNLNLEKYIEFFGHIDDLGKIKQLYKDSDIFVLSSKMEGFPRVIVEAMSQSMPVITTRVGGIKEIFKNNDTALFFNPGGYLELAEKIERVIKDRNLRKKLIRNGCDFAEKELSLPNPEMIIAKKIKQEYNRNIR
ncbi:MAG: glycosyltransferase [Acidobacteriota bacterium]